jgi:putative iron-regulated protein
MKKANIIFLSILAMTVVLTACKKKDEGPSTELKKSAINNYANIVYENYTDALEKANAMQTAIDAFVANPTQTSFDAAKTAWLEARNPYGQTEVYRFYGGPIDNDIDGSESLLNAWPMDEAFIDYVQGNSLAGIINNPVAYPTINKTIIESLNENGGETNVSCGFHAVEFLLWGQDLSTTSAGTRPYTDYVALTGTAQNQARRGQYLSACASLIVDHLQTIKDAWSPSTPGNYRNEFVNANPDASLSKIIQGMGFLAKGELAGERLEVAYDSQLQEDEHSCFSDNTHNDVRMNALAILNIYNGSYQKTNGAIISGVGIHDVLLAKDATLATETKASIEKAKNDAYAIAAPFDQQILSSNVAGRTAINNTIIALKKAGDDIAKAANLLGLSIVVE